MARYQFDYYTGKEIEQFRFLMVPKELLENPDYEELGLAGCILYSYLREQVLFSEQNGWIDEEGHTYVIRSVESMQKALHGCSEDKARAALKKLIDFGLVEKKRRGQGRPDLIYVKNFASRRTENSGSEKPDECGQLFSDSEKTGFLTPEKSDSRTGKNRFQESGKSGSIDNIYINTMSLDTNHYHIRVEGDRAPLDGSDSDTMESDICRIKRNIEYDILSERYRDNDNKLFEELYCVMVDVVVGEREYDVIGGSKYPHSMVRDRFLSLNAGHIEYVLRQIAENEGEIRNIRKYMVAALFNAPSTMSTFYTQKVNHDMAKPYSDEVRLNVAYG